MPEHSGISKGSLTYRCGGSAGLVVINTTHRLPVSPCARRRRAPETGAHL